MKITVAINSIGASVLPDGWKMYLLWNHVTGWPHIDKYVKETEGTQEKIPDIKSFSTAQQCTGDPLFPAKLQMFITQAMSLKPYLKKYQNETLMGMATNFENIHNALMYRFSKKDVLQGANAAKLAIIYMDKNLEKDNKVLQHCIINFHI